MKQAVRPATADSWGSGWRLVLMVVMMVRLSQTVTPTLTLDRKVALLAEKERSIVQLASGSCISSPASNKCYVTVGDVYPSNPCGNCFVVYPCKSATEFCLQYLPGQGFLSPSVVNQYVISVTGQDLVTGDTAEALVDIRIAANLPPYFTPPMTVDVTVSSARDVTTGQVLATVTATDVEDDQLTFSMTTLPDVGGKLVIDSVTGTIRAVDSLRDLCIPDVSAFVTVQDPYNPPVGPYVVNIDLKGANIAPIITNLNRELLVREDESVGSTLLTLAGFDPYVYPSTAYSVVFLSPAGADRMFHVVGNEVKVKGQLDYERQPRTVLMGLRATDGFCRSPIYTLYIRVLDVNEPPILLPADQTLQSCEGQVDIVPKWDNVTDPDADDIVTFINIAPNPLGRFYINRITGIVATTIDYNVDGDEHPTSVSLLVTLSDQQHLTATATLSLRFADCNDNPPVFDKPSREFPVGDCNPAGSVLGTVVKATDQDSDYLQNNVISYSGSGAGVTVEASGSIVTTKQFTAGQWVTFPAYATDRGKVPGPLTSSPYWVSVYCEPCPVTTKPPRTSTTTAPNTTQRTTTPGNSVNPWGGNQGWILAGCGLGTLLFCLLTYMGVRHLYPSFLRSCQRPANPGYPRRTSRQLPAQRPTQQEIKAISTHDTPQQQQPYTVELPPDDDEPPAQDSGNSESAPKTDGNFEWWKENYADNDYALPPDRQAPPLRSLGPANGHYALDPRQFRQQLALDYI